MTQQSNVTLACDITDPVAFETRKLSVLDLLKGATNTTETADGYTLQFPSDNNWFLALATFIDAERQCCAFFQFDLSVSPNHGPISLTLRGSADVKTFLKQQFIGMDGQV